MAVFNFFWVIKARYYNMERTISPPAPAISERARSGYEGQGRQHLHASGNAKAHFPITRAQIKGDFVK